MRKFILLFALALYLVADPVCQGEVDHKTHKLTEEEVSAFVRVWPAWQKENDPARRQQLAGAANLTVPTCQQIESLVVRVGQEVAAQNGRNDPDSKVMDDMGIAMAKAMSKGMAGSNADEIARRTSKQQYEQQKQAVASYEKSKASPGALRSEERTRLENGGLSADQLKAWDKLVDGGEDPSLASMIVMGLPAGSVEMMRQMQGRGLIDKVRQGTLEGNRQAAGVPATQPTGQGAKPDALEKASADYQRAVNTMVSQIVGQTTIDVAEAGKAAAETQARSASVTASATKPAADAAAVGTLFDDDVEAANLAMVRKHAAQFGVAAAAQTNDRLRDTDNSVFARELRVRAAARAKAEADAKANAGSTGTARPTGK